MTPAQRHARQSQAHVLSHARQHEGCWWCQDGHTARPGTEPAKCERCRENERIAEERAEK